MDLIVDFTLPRRDFDLRFELSPAGRITALIGASGAGKTSALRGIAGLEHPRDGRVAMGSEVWFDSTRRIDLPPERRRIGYLPQDYGLFPHLSVSGNVRFAAGRDRPDLLEQMGIAPLAGVRPGALSAGERQRVALARALAREPRVLLLDEPFGALDAITRARVRTELGAVLTSLDLPALVVTHDFEDAASLADEIAVLDRGRLIQVGPPAQLLRAPTSALVAALTGALCLHGTAEVRAGGSVLHLDGGGELLSSIQIRGRVVVAVDPWALELTDPAEASLRDTVLSVRPDRGGHRVTLGRFSVLVRTDAPGELPHPGAIAGVRAEPDAVRAFALEARSGR